MPRAATARLAATAPLAAPAPLAETAPLAATAPLGRAARRAEKLSYEVYAPDDTLPRARPLRIEPLAARRRTIGLFALGVAVALSTALMAIGSFDDGAPGRAETTSAAVMPQPSAPATTTAKATATATAPDVIPPIVFSPPLAPPPRRGSRSTPKR
jgi:hypothetical protein